MHLFPIPNPHERRPLPGARAERKEAGPRSVPRQSARMRILVHDFGGYAFALQLSRSLSRRGHRVCHAYCASLATTPPGVAGSPGDAVEVRSIDLGRPLNKYALLQRWRQEEAYGRLIARECRAFRPDVVLSGNAPLSAQRHIVATCRRQGVPFVFWIQDFLGIAAHRILRKRLPVVGEAIGRYFIGLERRLLRQSDAVVAISGDFARMLQARRPGPGSVSVIENWACLPELPAGPRRNAWALRHELADHACFLYAGTLSMKHNPDLLLQLALRLRAYPGACVVVISQGMGAEWLKRQKVERRLDQLRILPYQPKEELPEVYATADVLLAILEEEAGVFSVPSKVLTYLCAKRPLLLAVPEGNLAARTVRKAGAGIVVSPSDGQGFVEAAEALLQDPVRREAMGAAARAHAERTFDIERITDRFLAVLAEVTA